MSFSDAELVGLLTDLESDRVERHPSGENAEDDQTRDAAPAAAARQALRAASFQAVRAWALSSRGSLEVGLIGAIDGDHFELTAAQHRMAAATAAGWRKR